MIKIEIERDEQSGGMQWHPVTVTIDGKEHNVTVCEMQDAASGTSSFEVTWVDETPADHEEIEKQILAKF